MDAEKNTAVKGTKKQKSRFERFLFILVSVFVIMAVVIMSIATIYVYELRFGQRYHTPQWNTLAVEDFEELKVEECTFKSNDGQTLAGYHYYKDNQQIKGVLVFAHGIGTGGHNRYMNLVDYFASNGYKVFSYDVTGNDKSEGDGVEGLPQGLIDLDHALQFVKQSPEYKDLPIFLCGHSWGGFSVGSVLNLHPDVKAVAMFAGFDRTTEVFEQQGRTMIGEAIRLFMPYVSLYERIKFGKYASYTALEGFDNSTAGIMIIHSENDGVVFKANGYDKYYEKYGNNSRFKFVSYKDRGHTYVYNSEESLDYWDKINVEYSEYEKTHAGENREEIYEEFMEQYLDREKAFELDAELMSDIIDFFDMHL